MIYILYGENGFAMHEAFDALRAELDTDEMLADNTVRVEASDAKPDELLAACRTMPFLGTTRLVAVRGLLDKFESGGRRPARRKKGDATGIGPWQAFVDGLDALPDSTALVFLDGVLRPRNPMLSALKALKPAPKVTGFKKLSRQAVPVWVRERAARYDVKFDGRAVAALTQLVGDDLWTLDSEIQKLSVYAAGKTVTEEEVRSLVSRSREESVFAMADAVVEGRTGDAARLVQRLLADGESPQRLQAMIARQCRLLLITKELQAQRVARSEMEARLGVRDFVVPRLTKQARLWTVDGLRRAYRRLLEADLSVKRGIYDEETALHLLVVELASLARPGPTLPGGRQGYSRPRAAPAPSR